MNASALDTLRTTTPEVKAVALLDGDGTILASSSDREIENVVAPIMTTLTTIAARSAQELGRGGLETVIVEATDGLILARDLGGGRTLACIATRHAGLGLLLDDLAACAVAVSALGEAAHG